MVAYAYLQLPEELPLSRWTSAPKSMFLALRIPVINLLTIGLAELLARALSRVPAEHRLAAERVAATLLVTAGVKAWFVSKELLALPSPSPMIRVGSFVIVATGLSLAGWFAYPLWEGKVLRGLRWTPLEWILVGSAVAGIIVLNLPLVLPRAFS
jgi:hypothetical protein